MTKEDIHIGKLISKELKKDGRTKKWLSEKIGCCRTNIYKILSKPSIDVFLLQKISIALKKNFFEELAAFCQKELEENK